MTDEKKTTALGTPVGADVGQSNQSSSVSLTDTPAEINNEFVDEEATGELMRKIRLMNEPSYLPTVTMQELYDNVYQTRQPIIDGLLYAGTYIFAGAPKVGKSFFMAQLAYHVSTGQKLWDFEVHQGTVLYLALEDDYRRLQERMYRMFGVEGTDHLHFAVYAKQLGDGLDEQLDRFVTEHPDTKLVIIDTLQKIREVGGEAYSYADDYKNIGRLKRFADQKNLCLNVVHHTRKSPAGDKFDMISGTTGLLGCADGAFVLRKENRTDNTAILDVVGRDQPDQQIHLVRDEQTLTWCLDHVEKELWKPQKEPLLEKVAALLAEDRSTWTGSASELVALLDVDMQPNILTRRLNVKCGDLKNDYGITYTIKRNRHGSCISLSRLEQ